MATCRNLLAAALIQLQECSLACIAGCTWHPSALVWWGSLYPVQQSHEGGKQGVFSSTLTCSIHQNFPDSSAHHYNKALAYEILFAIQAKCPCIENPINYSETNSTAFSNEFFCSELVSCLTKTHWVAQVEFASL